MKEELLNSRWGRAEQPDPGAAARLCARVESESQSRQELSPAPGLAQLDQSQAELWMQQHMENTVPSTINRPYNAGAKLFESVSYFAGKKKKIRDQFALPSTVDEIPEEKKTKQNQLKNWTKLLCKQGCWAAGKEAAARPLQSQNRRQGSFAAMEKKTWAAVSSWGFGLSHPTEWPQWVKLLLCLFISCPVKLFLSIYP